MNWVYTLAAETRKRPSLKPVTAVTTGFFSSLFGSFTGSSTPQKHITPLPIPATPINLLETSETSIILSVFSADVSVRLSTKLSSEIRRSTKKNPPSSMKYELIYVNPDLLSLTQTRLTLPQTAKDKYDASKQEESKHSSSIFQGLRADLDGYAVLPILLCQS